MRERWVQLREGKRKVKLTVDLGDDESYRNWLACLSHED
jgi:hypothetical protein